MKQIDAFLKEQLSNKNIPLGEILLDKGFVTAEQLEEALEKGQNEGYPLGVALLELNFVNPAQLKVALQDQAAIKKISAKKQRKRRRLGEILLSAGVCTPEQLAASLEFSAAHGMKIGESLVQLGIVTEDELAQAVAEQLMIPYVKLSKTPPDAFALEKVPAKVCEKHQVIPVKLEEEDLFLAMVDPQNILVVDDIEKSTGLKVVPMIVAEKDFRASFEAHYGEAAQAGQLLEMIDDSEDKSLEDMAGEDFDEDSAPIKHLTNKLVSNAVELGTSDIHIEPFEHTVVVRYRVDGMMRTGAGPFPAKVAPPISSRIKVMSGLDISEVRQPQDGKFRLSLKGKIVDVRVSTCPVNWGEKIVMRILDQSGGRLRLNDLGLDHENLSRLNEALGAPNGIILVTGPTGSGKTTTLYSALVSLNKPSVNIQTAEDPVEYDLPGICQSQCISEIGMTFASVLKAFLRQDPDIILIGEIRDQETAQIALKAALTGHLVLSTLHTNSAVESVGRLLNMGLDRFLVAAAVRAILAQRLMRRLCDVCKEPVQLSQKQLAEAGFSKRLMAFEGAQGYDIKSLMLHRAGGCKKCGDGGYKGRCGIHEVLPFTPAISSAIISEATTLDMKQLALNEGMLSLRDSALLRVIQGKSSLEEADRLTVNEEKVAANAGDDDLIDEILIRSGTWKLSAKDILARKKQGKYVPGEKGRLERRFIMNDEHEVEKELRAMEEEGSDSSGGGLSKEQAVVFENILQELRSLKQGDIAGKSSKAAKIINQAETGVEIIQICKTELKPQKKSIPLNVAVVQDIYQKIPAIAASLSTRTGQKIELGNIRFSKEFSPEKFPFAADWGLLRIAFTQILENHIEAVKDGGAIKFSSKVSEINGKKIIEFVVRDNQPKSISPAKDPLTSGFTTKPGRLGLGLTAAHKIITAHGGKIEIKIINGKGCMTKLTFPEK